MKIMSKAEYLRETDDRPRLQAVARAERPVVGRYEPPTARRPIETVDQFAQRPSKPLTDAEVEAVGRATLEAIDVANGNRVIIKQLVAHARKRLRGEWLDVVEEAAR